MWQEAEVVAGTASEHGFEGTSPILCRDGLGRAAVIVEVMNGTTQMEWSTIAIIAM
jgi:hypothetical protein